MNESNVPYDFHDVKMFKPDILRSETPVRIFQIERLDTANLIDLAILNWNSTYSIPEVEFRIDRLLKSSDKLSRSEDLKYLHHVRESGLILKSAWIMLTTEHKAPPRFVRLLKDIGVINSQSKSNTKRQKARARILDFDRSNDDISGNIYIGTFDPAPSYEVLNYFLGMCLDLNTMIIDTPKIISSENFHRIRKDYIRNIMNLFRIAAVSTNDKDVVQTFQYLKQIDRKFGHRRDFEIKHKNSEIILDTDFVFQLRLFIQKVCEQYS